ncbi:aminotransferase [Acetobacter syzygii]|uniref:aminotransferase class I/II-fold pyridoxal phosphate-dependent enzyme n=1 Tax=Acetobacter syzygii TaxID=146476 RepID=UPI0005DDC4C7|nr:aminotransferase class I/II-fold pyridoxal phosphate-dependent enzyme [Acetobacter syzygii]GAN70453.1 aminotransferase [Acetobacter syzygii]GBR61786.1 aminotransferase [Acetobacter syzygii NRIC 0483]GEL56937.1 aminotransferase [Acetobacter syzygii]
MVAPLPQQTQQDFKERGFSRRQIGRIALVLGAGSVMAGMPWHKSRADTLPVGGIYPPGSILLNGNEFWTGPFPSALPAGQKALLNGNRYLTGQERQALVESAAAYDHISPDLITPWPGSSDPLCRTVISFCSPTQGLVTCDPTYETVWGVAEWLQIPLAKVPLRADNGYKVDVRAMLKANPNAGMYYICSPNNPTGTVTPLADIAWLARHIPPNAVLVVDEAYLHFCNAPSAVSLLGSCRNIIVLRTFSKLFGMAGLRLGLSIAHPALHEKMMRYDGIYQTTMLSVPAAVIGTDSLKDPAEVAKRRSETRKNRKTMQECLSHYGVRTIPSEANMLMADWRKSPDAITAAFAQNHVIIGRSWSIWPTCSRISVGSTDDVQVFCKAMESVASLL